MTEILTRDEQPEDIATIRLIVAAAFGQSNEADLVDRLREEEHLHASSVAVVEGQLIGHAALSRGSVSGQRVLILAPVSVSPAFQGQGVGVAVVEHVLASTTTPVVVLGDPGYYSRFGFEDASAHGISDQTFPAPPGAFQVLRPEPLRPGVIQYPSPFIDL